jgi:tetratricopeptide (TPR) repeat protein
MAFAYAQNGTAPIVIDYPANGSIFPPDMAAPVFLWRDPAVGAVSWRIDVSFADGSAAIHATSKGEPMRIGEIDPRCVSPNNKPPSLTPEQAAAHTWMPDAADWAAIKKQSVAGPATIAISGFAAGNGGQALSRGQMLLHTSVDPVGAPIFYRDVPLMPSKSQTGVIKPLDSALIPLIAWRLRDVSQPQSRVLLTDMHTCANCHSFADNGSTLGMDLDGPDNDKSLYTLAPVQKVMTIRNEDVVSWASFRDELGSQLRVGFMSRVSPDGRRVVTTIKPPGANRDQLYYVSNFTDYRFLQVFYPVSGILVWYDRDAKKLQPLPGADDPKYVQANAVWSPDGKYLVFDRAVAKSPSPPGGKMATYANDPAEVQIQYDLYRIPFNDGKGGKAEPIAGASQNGMSNSFPKVSPDGKWIVFVQAKNGLLMRPDSKLYIVPAEGGQARLMSCNTSLMNSWHSFSPNGRWLVFSSKSRTPYTQMFLTHIDAEGHDSPAILIENSTAANRAVNIPEFVNTAPGGIERIDVPAADFYRQFDVAAALTKKGDFAAAIAEWTKTLAMGSDDARARYNYGLSLAGTGRTEDAIAQYRKALAMQPDYADAHNNLGNALARTGHLDEAIPQYRLAVESDPESPEAHNNLGAALMREGTYDEAIVQFQKALELRPGGAMAEANLGHALLVQNKTDEAKAHLERALQISPDMVEARFDLGAVLMKNGQRAEALALWRQALRQAPDNLRVLNDTAWALATCADAALRDGTEAVTLAEHAVQLSSGREPSLLGTLAAAYAEAGRFDKAVEFEKRATDVATQEGNATLAATLRTRLALLQKNTPIRQP